MFQFLLFVCLYDERIYLFIITSYHITAVLWSDMGR